jgi:hypothetical protein
MPEKKRRAKTKRSAAAKKRVAALGPGTKKPKPKAAAAKLTGGPKEPPTPPKARAPVATFASKSVTAQTIAPQKPCLPLPQAVLLVLSCAKVPPDLPLSTQLGQIFPAATARNSFCQCVADGVPTDRSQIPCAATNTLQDVVDAIAC